MSNFITVDKDIMSGAPVIRSTRIPIEQIMFPRLNGLFDVKHIRDDLNKSGIPDKEVYALAVALNRLIVTFNAKDFKQLASASLSSGVIAVSPHLSSHQIDTKLTALLVKSSEKALAGKFTTLSEAA